MAAVDDLVTAETQIAARIKEVTASANPDYSIAGRSISKGAYLSMLVQQLQAVRQAILIQDGPWDISSRGVT